MESNQLLKVYILCIITSLPPVSASSVVNLKLPSLTFLFVYKVYADDRSDAFPL